LTHLRRIQSTLTAPAKIINHAVLYDVSRTPRGQQAKLSICVCGILRHFRPRQTHGVVLNVPQTR
jgi:hypothetical protein